MNGYLIFWTVLYCFGSAIGVLITAATAKLSNDLKVLLVGVGAAGCILSALNVAAYAS